MEDKPGNSREKNIRQPAIHDLSLQKRSSKAPGGINRHETHKMDNPPSPRQKLPASSHDLTSIIGEVKIPKSSIYKTSLVSIGQHQTFYIQIKSAIFLVSTTSYGFGKIFATHLLFCCHNSCIATPTDWRRC
jgi:hypothetical protein